VIRLDPNNVDAYKHRFMMYVENKDSNDKIVADLEAILRLEPNNTEMRAILDVFRK